MSIRRLIPLAALAMVVVASPAGHARLREAERVPATRIVFSGWDLDVQQIYSVEPSGRRPAQLTFALLSSSNPVPSQDGRRIAFIRDGNWLMVMDPDGRHQHRLAAGASQPTWAPSSKRLAYVTKGTLRTIGVDGSGQHLIARGQVSSPSWSPDGRSLAYARGDRLVVSRSGRQRTITSELGPIDALSWSPDSRWIVYERPLDGGLESELHLVRQDGSHPRLLGLGHLPVWSPDGRRLAFVRLRGQSVMLFDLASGSERRLASGNLPQALAWSPDGGRIAYATGPGPGSITTVTLGGTSKPVLMSAFPYSYDLSGLAWTAAPNGLRYRPPRPVELATRSELLLRRPVVRLAADGDRVAYQFCESIGVWQPGDARVVPVRLDSPPCTTLSSIGYGVYDLALADDSVAWGMLAGGMHKLNWLTTAPVEPNALQTVVAAPVASGAYGYVRAGHLAGSGSLLAFSTWVVCYDLGQSCTGGQLDRVVTQSVWRVRESSWPGVCPLSADRPNLPEGRCQKLATEPGPLVPYDADSGRIAAVGDNSVVLIDRNGARLLQILAKASAAQLSGSDLLVVMQGQLRHYDTTIGSLLHSWPFPEAAQLQDIARRLAVYLLNGKVHLLRLADGADVLVAGGTAARFGSSGLFYAYQAPAPWRGRIRFVPFDQLPIKSQ